MAGSSVTTPSPRAPAAANPIRRRRPSRHSTRRQETAAARRPPPPRDCAAPRQMLRSPPGGSRRWRWRSSPSRHPGRRQRTAAPSASAGPAAARSPSPPGDAAALLPDAQPAPMPPESEPQAAGPGELFRSMAPRIDTSRAGPDATRPTPADPDDGQINAGRDERRGLTTSETGKAAIRQEVRARQEQVVGLIGYRSGTLCGAVNSDTLKLIQSPSTALVNG